MDDCENIKLLYEGGQGYIYEIRCKDGVNYAKKVLKDIEDNNKRRFEREIRIISTLDHKNIVPIKDYDTSNQCYYIMPLADGNLRDYLNSKFGESELWIFNEILNGVKICHDKGIIHRDLKPQNVLLFEKKGGFIEIGISDFGLGFFYDRDTTVLTSTTGMGTFEYCSPEQMRNARDVDHRTDIYSLGAILSEILTGRIFYDEGTKNIPKKYLHIIMKSTNPDPSKRYQSIDELIEAVVNVEKGIYLKPKDAIKQENELIEKDLKYLIIGTEKLMQIYTQNLEDRQIFLECLPYTKKFILEQMIKRYDSEFEIIFSQYDNYVSENSNFEYCSIIANFYYNVFTLTQSYNIKSLIITTLPIMGYSANRWHVGEIFAKILAIVDDPNLIEEVYTLFKNNTNVASFCMEYCKGCSLPIRLNEFR